MIKIDHSPPSNSGWHKWLEKCSRATADAIQDFKNSGAVVFDKNLYKETKCEYYLLRKGPFHGKCAYCEKMIASDQHADIDHYRPKAGVTDENDLIIEVTIEGASRPHPGYYWLAYDWKNLLPSCELCNRHFSGRQGNESLGKRNRFPVDGTHAVQPGGEANEKPMLINPTVDDPKNHFTFDGSGVLGLMTSEAELTEKVLGLNKRGLPDERKEKYELIEASAKQAFISILDGNPDQGKLMNLLKIYEGASEFTMAARSAIDVVDGRANGALKSNIEAARNGTLEDGA